MLPAFLLNLLFRIVRFCMTAAMTTAAAAAAPCLWIFTVFYLPVNHITAIQANATCQYNICEHILSLLSIQIQPEANTLESACSGCCFYFLPCCLHRALCIGFFMFIWVWPE